MTKATATVTDEYTLPAKSKAKRIGAYKEHIKTNPAIVLDAGGEPLTDNNYFNGLLRPPVGLKTPVSRKLLNSNVSLKSQIHEGVKSLKAQASNWEVTYYKTASQHLYVLLAGTYELLAELNAYETDLKKLREAVTTFATGLNVRYKSSTSMIAILINCVFKDIPSQRRCAYGLGLQAIINVYGLTLTKQKVIDMITAAGGIYELARPYPELDSNANAIDKDIRDSKYFLNLVKSTSLYQFSDLEFADLIPKTSTQYLAVVTKDGSGKVTVNAISESDSLLLRIGKKLSESKESSNSDKANLAEAEAELAKVLLGQDEFSEAAIA